MHILRIVILLGYLSFISQWPSPAWGHGFPHKVEPAAGAKVDVPPVFVRIWFDAILEPAFSKIQVFDDKGKQVDNGDSRLDPNNAKLLEVSLPPLTAGIYRIKWSAVARDGHKTKGDHTFTIKPPE